MLKRLKLRNSIDLNSESRLIADAARDAGAWAVAAKAYRAMLQIDPADGGIWLQCGHMLKELGLFRDARGHYEKALALSPSDPEIHFQLGLLAKVSGDFSEAIRSLQRAAELGYEPRESVAREIKLATPRRPFSLLSGHAQEAPAIRVFLSSIAGSPIVENSGGTNGDVKFFEKYDLSPDKNLSVICKPTFVTLQC